ncbi:MAG: homoserine kinase [Candidatus Dechloromonas phosphoritropha]
MSVYTTVEPDELALWFAPLGLGAPGTLTGIAAGMQNSNYFVTASGRRWVLTIFEHLAPRDLDFCLALQEHLAARGIPCPRPLAAADGRFWRPLAGKPAALFTCLPGDCIEAATVAHCRTLGAMLARLHLAGADFPSPLPNPCGHDWRERTGRRLAPALSADERGRLRAELDFQAAQDYSGLPHGIVHGDLFRDNVLWQDNEELSGVLDFYFAGADSLLFDLTVVANDWCPEADQLAALIAGYSALRPLTSGEEAAWPALRRAAALRFWLLRLDARQHPRPGAVVTIKDPDHFGQLLRRLCLAQEGSRR